MKIMRIDLTVWRRQPGGRPRHGSPFTPPLVRGDCDDLGNPFRLRLPLRLRDHDVRGCAEDAPMKLRVLGSVRRRRRSQWNCNCRNCRRSAPALPTTSAAPSRPSPSAPRPALAAGQCLARHPAADPQRPGACSPRADPRQRHRGGAADATRQIDHSTGLLHAARAQRAAALWSDRPGASRTSARATRSCDVLGHYCGVDWQPIALDGQSLPDPGVAES